MYIPRRRKIYSCEGDNAKNCWSTQPSHKFMIGKENKFSFIDVIFFALSAYIGNVCIESH